MKIYYINYDAIPGPDSPDFEATGGASINCWIKAASAEEAQIMKLSRPFVEVERTPVAYPKLRPPFCQWIFAARQQ